MAGAAVTPAPSTGISLNGGGGPPNTGINASELNGFRISAVIDRLSLHVYSHRKIDSIEFLNLCLSLARGIDFAITNREVPSRSRELPSLLKQVCQNKNDTLQQAAIMVLMISVKSACQSGWFADVDSQELSNLAKEVATIFSSVPDSNTEPSCSHVVISTIISRFYPRMKIGHIFAFLEVKPGFDAYVSDFQITKNMKSSPGDKIRLFVVQTDSIETSSCLVSPAKVNFLLNGKGVERRTSLFMDTGPQIPTVVTPLLKYGSNLLQAVGEFNGNYIIAVAFMSEMPKPDSIVLQDYEQHTPTTVDSDSEVIVGSSRISLNCPISFRRIKTPVKGHSCKHIQCFDFDNYVDINSRRPSWRCPHCNQHVCFTDIRIDQKMVKVLKEVGPNVSDVIVSSDWSWNAVDESEDTLKKPEDKTFSMGDDESPRPADVLDLTQTDDAMDADANRGTEDVKNFQNAFQSKLLSQTTAINPHIASTNGVNQSGDSVANDFWSEVYRSTFGLSSNVRPNAQNAGVSISNSILSGPFSSPNRELDGFHGNALDTTSVPPSGTSLPNTLQLQQYQFGNPPINNDYGRFAPAPRHIMRTPVAVQALPAQTPTPVQRSSINNTNTFTPNSLPAASQASRAAPNFSTMSRANPHQVSPISTSSLLQCPGIQQNRPFLSSQPPQQNAGFRDPNQVPNAYRVSNGHGSSQQMANLRMPRATSQSPGLTQSSIQSSGSLICPHSHAGVAQDRTIHRTGVASSQQSHLIAAANRTAQMAFDTSRTAPSYSRNPDGRSLPSLGDQRSISGVASQPVVRTDASGPAEMNWRPAGRMRGALSGQAYADALNQYIIRPNQQAQAAMPISNVTTVPTNAPVQLQGLVSGPVPNYLSAELASRPVGWDLSPDISSGSQ